MISRLVHAWIIRIVAWGLRRGITNAEALEALGRALPHRDPAWRYDVVDRAVVRNMERDRPHVDA